MVGLRLLLGLHRPSGGRAELFGIDAICVSHLHVDHCVDLSSYWVARQAILFDMDIAYLDAARRERMTEEGEET